MKKIKMTGANLSLVRQTCMIVCNIFITKNFNAKFIK